MDLHEALSQIAEIRVRVAAAERFRGYRAAPVALTGLLAVLTALIQPLLVPDPRAAADEYLMIWIGAAGIGGLIAGSGIWLRHRQSTDRVGKRLTWLAVGQFVPCLAAGAVVTLMIARHAPENVALLPGLWQVFFSLGVFASCRLMPRAIAAVGVLYLFAGGLNLAWAAGPAALSPWVMGLPFGLGQFITAAVLYWNLERGPHDRTA